MFHSEIRLWGEENSIDREKRVSPYKKKKRKKEPGGRTERKGHWNTWRGSLARRPPTRSFSLKRLEWEWKMNISKAPRAASFPLLMSTSTPCWGGPRALSLPLPALGSPSLVIPAGEVREREKECKREGRGASVAPTSTQFTVPRSLAGDSRSRARSSILPVSQSLEESESKSEVCVPSPRTSGLMPR